MARARGCTVQHSALPDRVSGLLVPVERGFALKINVQGVKSSVRRQRFTIAHEIAHTFFYRFRPDGRPEKVTGPLNQYQEEELCDLAAGRLLVPQQLIRRSPLARVRDASLGMIAAASRMFQVSHEVAARRLKQECAIFSRLGLCEWVAEDLYLRTRQLNFSKNSRFRPLVLAWLVPPEPGKAIALPRGTRLTRKTPIWELCLGERSSVEGAEIRVGSKLIAKLGDAVVRRQGYKLVSVLATIQELRMFSSRKRQLH